jgi:hypothetical protein
VRRGPLPDRGVKIGLAAHQDAARWLSAGIHPLSRVNTGGRAFPARYSRQPGGCWAWRLRSARPAEAVS